MDDEAEVFVARAGERLASTYEIRALDRKGRPRTVTICGSLPAAQEWLFYHPGRRYWLTEIRHLVGRVIEYDLTTDERARETCPVAAGMLRDTA